MCILKDFFPLPKIPMALAELSSHLAKWPSKRLAEIWSLGLERIFEGFFSKQSYVLFGLNPTEI